MLTTIAFTGAAFLLALFGLLCVMTADAIRSYRANRKAEAASLSKRQHEAAVAQFANILREALLQRGKK
jgi:hypothetical protein